MLPRPRRYDGSFAGRGARYRVNGNYVNNFSERQETRRNAEHELRRDEITRVVVSVRAPLHRQHKRLTLLLWCGY
jgi:hypothetical protein